MREFTVGKSHDNKRIDKFLFECLSSPSSVIYKAFRKRSVRVNHRRVKEDYILHSGDVVELFIPEAYLDESSRPSSVKNNIITVYEDEYILIVSKPQGMPVHDDKNREGDVLDEYIRKEYSPERDLISGFPALCHRIDRNTGGLVIFAKDPKSLDIMEQKFKHHEIRKFYLAYAYGIPEKKEAHMVAYLKKDSQKSRVYIYDNPVEGSERIVTRYRMIKASYPYSLLEVEIITGKTHQIRAHLAYTGLPILGDGKYGINSINRSLKLKYQALFSYRLIFNFQSPSAHLEYLNGMEISLPEIPWEQGITLTGMNDDR